MATLTEEKCNDVTWLRLVGGLTFDGVLPVIKLFEAATVGGRVVVDLSEVPIISTPGLSLLLSGLKRQQHHGGRLVVASPTRHVRDLLRRCRLDRVFDLADDAAMAAAILGEDRSCRLAKGASPADAAV